jgi:hypothetical protein
MGLLDKVRILVGALVHKPFTPRPEKANLDGHPEPPRDGSEPRERVLPQAMEAAVEDTDRVADLIARQRHEEAQD